MKGILSLIIAIAVAALAGCAAPAVYEREAEKEDPEISSCFTEEKGMKTIYLAGGCFWGVQKYLDKNPGGYCHIPKAMFSLEQTEE